MAAISRVYNGDDPFVFISYSHRDEERVHKIANELIDEGYRVWYDDGIETATRFPDVIAEHVERCSVFTIFVSAASMASNFVVTECEYALKLEKCICVVFLEDEKKCNIPAGLRMFFSSIEHIKIDSPNFDVRLRAPLKDCRESREDTKKKVPAAEADTYSTGKKKESQSDAVVGSGVLRFENGVLKCGDETFDANVRRLDLRGKGITDISALQNLTKLNILVLSENEITDISPLAKIKSLSTLNISGNKVRELSSLADLRLMWLILTDNPIGDISPLLEIKTLSNLYVNKTGISPEDKEKLKSGLPKCRITF